MRNLEKDAIEMAQRKQKLMEEGFRLFSEKNIDAVSMLDVSKACQGGRGFWKRDSGFSLQKVLTWFPCWMWQKHVGVV